MYHIMSREFGYLLLTRGEFFLGGQPFKLNENLKFVVLFDIKKFLADLFDRRNPFRGLGFRKQFLGIDWA